MSYKLNRLIFTALVAAVGVIAIAGSASAQSIFGDSIPGTFFAINDDNTGTQVGRILGNDMDLGTRFTSDSVDGGTEFLFGTVPFWQQRETVLTGGNSAGSELSFTGVFDPAIVTTITDLEAGTYDVEFIFLATRGNGNFQYRTGFEADSTTQILDTFDFTGNGGLVATEYQEVGVSGFVDGTLVVNGLQAFGSFIGETTVGADGVLSCLLYTSPSPRDRG